jgi:hypothetical protein
MFLFRMKLGRGTIPPQLPQVSATAELDTQPNFQGSRPMPIGSIQSELEVVVLLILAAPWQEAAEASMLRFSLWLRLLTYTIPDPVMLSNDEFMDAGQDFPMLCHMSNQGTWEPHAGLTSTCM